MFVIILILFVVVLALAALLFDISVLRDTIKDSEILPTIILIILGLLLTGIIVGGILSLPTGITYCKSCTKVYWNQTYCEFCGDKLRDVKICSNCQTEFDVRTHYCPQCGHTLTSEKNVTNKENDT